jgi:caffeoyl-CoA O-methyltransferase
MESFTDAAVEKYIYDILPERDPVLKEIEGQAEKRNVPIVGPAVGRVLYQYARLINARKIFELGSAIGYSTIWWAQAAGADGEIFYTDTDEKNAAEAQGYFRRAGVDQRIHVKVGDALDLLAQQNREFDIIFNDVNKEYYPAVLDLVLPRLRRGGLFITDNVLWSGRVTESDPKEETTRAIQEFNRRLYAMPEFFTTVFPLRDGVSVSLKL